MKKIQVIKGDLQTMLDVTSPESVEVEISEDGRIWVNVDGVCMFRACRCKRVGVVGKGITHYYAGKDWKG